MGRNAIGAVAILLCMLGVRAIVFRERCRLGDVRWQMCNWIGMAQVGGPLPAPSI